MRNGWSGMCGDGLSRSITCLPNGFGLSESIRTGSRPMLGVRSALFVKNDELVDPQV